MAGLSGKMVGGVGVYGGVKKAKAPRGGYLTEPQYDERGQITGGTYRNEAGQTWDENYGWVGAPNVSTAALTPTRNRAEEANIKFKQSLASSQADAARAEQEAYNRRQAELDRNRKVMEDAQRAGAEQYERMQLERQIREAEDAPILSHAGIDQGREAAARDASFARAKDTIGQVARSSLTALRDEMAARGIASAPGMESGIEAAQEAALLNRAQGNLGDVVREQAINEAERAGRVADLDYQGRIQQQQAKDARVASLRALLANIGRR
jgi:hypothetical protein